MFRKLLLLPFALVAAIPVHAEEQPEFYTLDSASLGTWWKAESRVLVKWNDNRPIMRGLKCIVRYERQGTDPIEISISHPVESAEYSFQFKFELEDNQLSDRRVNTITIGGRPYQIRSVQSRIIPAFGVYRQNDIILSYGLTRDMFRPNEDYPWLPLEFLIPQFFEVEGIILGVFGDFEIKHGEYERRYESFYIRTEGFQDAMKWCHEQVNPSDDRNLKLPADLKRHLGK